MDRYRQLTEGHISADQLAFPKQIPKRAWEPPSFFHKGDSQVSFPHGGSIDGLQMIFTVVTSNCIPPATNLLFLGAGSRSSVLNVLPLERNDEPTTCLEGVRMLYFLLLS